MANIVAIVGRPNVGKSTLYNRLTESRKAIVDDYSGVTRDRHYGQADWIGEKFTVIDTGAFVPGSYVASGAARRGQALIASAGPSLILCVLDTTTGVADLDAAIAHAWRRSATPVYAGASRVDSAKQTHDSAQS